MSAIADAELDLFRQTVSCAAVLERMAGGWRLDVRGSTRRAWFERLRPPEGQDWNDVLVRGGRMRSARAWVRLESGRRLDLLELARGRGRLHPAVCPGLSRRGSGPAGGELPLTGHILDAANAVIARDRSRLGKTLFTRKTSGDRVEVVA